jgi:hypothetical protein
MHNQPYHNKDSDHTLLLKVMALSSQKQIQMMNKYLVEAFQ